MTIPSVFEEEALDLFRDLHRREERAPFMDKLCKGAVWTTLVDLA